MTWCANKSSFSKMPMPKGAKKRPREYIDPEAFILMRRRAFLTTHKAATALHVNHRTILNWESGKTRIPYTAFRVLKMLAGYVFNDEHFKDWFIKGDTLWSPEDRGFKPWELRYISNYFAMARLWIKERQELRTKTLMNAAIPAGAPSDDSPTAASVRARALPDAGGLLLSCGAAAHRETSAVPDALLSQQERPLEFVKFLEVLGISE